MYNHGLHRHILAAHILENAGRPPTMKTSTMALRFVDLGFSVVFVFFLPSLSFLIELRNVGELHFL